MAEKDNISVIDESKTINLHEKVMKHWLWKDSKKFQWWIIMLFEVNQPGRTYNVGKELFHLKKGQSANSLREWGQLFGATAKTVQKFFVMLEKDAIIMRKIVGKGKHSTTLINIGEFVNYNDDSKHKVSHKVSHKILHKIPHKILHSTIDIEPPEKEPEILELVPPENEDSKAYSKAVEFWLKEFHPTWTFKARHGSDLKSILSQIKKRLKAVKNEEPNAEQIFNGFKILCQKLPNFYKSKDLPTIDSKFNEIYEEIKKAQENGSNTKNTQQSGNRIKETASVGEDAINRLFPEDNK